MSIDALIDLVLQRVFKEHYLGKSRREEWHKSRTALIKSIARYGHECANRGWEFEPEAIWAELMRVLDTMRERSLEIEIWFPKYLECSIDRHIRLRADELSAEAKREDRRGSLHADPRSAAKLAGVVVADLRIGTVRQPTAVEQLAVIYRDLHRRQKARRRAAKGPTATQSNLL